MAAESTGLDGGISVFQLMQERRVPTKCGAAVLFFMSVLAMPQSSEAVTVVVTLTGVADTGATQSVSVREIFGANKWLLTATPTAGADAVALRDMLVGEDGDALLGFTAKRVMVDGSPGFMTRGDVEHQVRVLTGAGLTLLEPGTSIEYDGIIYSACDAAACSPLGAGIAPTISQWGLVILTLTLLTTGMLVFRSRRTQPA